MVSSRSKKSKAGFERVPFRMHPRVFSALGADLVTNDVVAVIELVKNCYDAFAENVWVKFTTVDDGESTIEIRDDGTGMNRRTIDEIWSVVATPHKEANPRAKKGSKIRRVVGEKGLGRLSVSRLGTRLQILTKSNREPCWELIVDWSELAAEDDLGNCYIYCRKYPHEVPFEDTGTIVRIEGLRSTWDESQIADLEENLARLISPFHELGDFNIYLARDGSEDLNELEEVHIRSPQFLSRPKYRIAGEVDEVGNVSARYTFSPIKLGKKRTKRLSIAWPQIYDDIQEKERFNFDPEEAQCGGFTFEIRAWDLATGDTEEIAQKFDFQKSSIRKSIRVHKGISVYRDGVLVLPKSEGARDWLGLDLRRVSKVGTRMSTSQLVGFVAISGDDNPEIVDTSDRERLASNRSVAEFEEILKSVVGLLEIERDHDRVKRDEPIKSLFEDLNADSLVASVNELADEGAEAAEAVPLVAAFNANLTSARKTIEERFTHYSRMATIGTIAQMLVHEIRNRTTAFGLFLDTVHSRFGPFDDPQLEKHYSLANGSVDALERLADTFSPLASRSFTRRKKKAELRESVDNCLRILRKDLDSKGVDVKCQVGSELLAVDPGELETVVLNLLTNAIFWLGKAERKQRTIVVSSNRLKSGNRVRTWVHDSGPGIEPDVIDKIFLPGVTRRPNGIGMGLTVAAEIVGEYGGTLVADGDGKLGGASMAFDLPTA